MAHVTNKCIKLVKKFEGLYKKAYRDEVGVWTIGYGITNADKSITGATIKAGLVISEKTADNWLERSLNSKYLQKVMIKSIIGIRTKLMPLYLLHIILAALMGLQLMELDLELRLQLKF